MSIIAFWAAGSLSLTAFGFAVIMVPLLSLAWDVKSAIVTSTILYTVLMFPLLYEVRNDIPVPRASPILLASLAGIPIGIVVFRGIEPTALQILVASVVIVIAIAFYLSPRIKLDRPHGFLSVLVGGLSGFVSSSTGMGGPPVVLYVLSFEGEVERLRATLLPVFLPTGIFILVGLAVSGFVDGDVLIASAVALPAVGLGTLAGVWLRSHISPAVFRTVVLAHLIASGIAVLTSASGVLD